MSKTALIFRGQPAQYPGMGINLSDNFQLAKEIYGLAERQMQGTPYSDALRFCFNPTSSTEAKRNTLLAHASLYTTNHVLYRLLVERCSELGVQLEFQAMAGHSLGQLNAFVAAGAIRFEDALSIALEGGDYLHQFSQQEARGGMASMFHKGDNLDEHLQYLARMSVYVGVHNAPGSVLIGGLESDLNEALDYLYSNRIPARKIEEIEGPFHTIHVKSVAYMIKPRINLISYANATVPVYANSTGGIISTADEFSTETSEQVYKMVRWKDIILNMTSDGVTRFVVIDPEEKPKKSIAGTISAANPTAEILVVRDSSSLDRIVEELTASDSSRGRHPISVP